MSAVIQLGGRIVRFGSGGVFSTGGGAPPPVVTGGLIKFIPGDKAMSTQYYHTTVANAITDFGIINAASGQACFNGYVAGYQWPALETGSNSLSPVYNFSVIWQVFNYMQAVWPGSTYGVLITGNHYTSTSLSQTQITSANLANPAGFYIPDYILNCGGSLTVPNSLGSGSTTTYAVAPIYSGATTYGLNFQDFSSGASPPSTEVMNSVFPQWYNPGIVQAFTNFMQALSQSVCPTPAAWSAGTVYSAGIQVTNGGLTFTYINASNTSGQPTSNTSFWTQTTQAYVGLTLDANPLVHFIGSNDEISYSFISGQNFSSGITLNPPQSVTGAVPSNTNFWILRNKWLYTAMPSFFPHTPIATCDSFGYTVGGFGSDTGPNFTANMNANLPSGNRSAPVALSTIGGLIFSNADAFGHDFNATTNSASTGKQGVFGISTPGTFNGALPSPSVASVAGTRIGYIGNVQGGDYFHNVSGAGRNQSAVAQIAAACANLLGQFRHWAIADDLGTGGTAYIIPGVAATQGTNPVSTLRPVNLMTGVTINSVTVASATSLIVNYSLFALNPAETGLTTTIFRNGVSVATGQTSGTFTDTGLTQGTTYTYTAAVANSNGTGPVGSGVSGTTSAPSWKTLPVGGGGFVRGLIIAADGTMVGRTDTAGAYLYSSVTSSWNQLITSSSMPAAFITANFNAGLGGVYEFAIAPSNTQIFYMMASSGGTSGQSTMWKSANQGATWTQLTAFGNQSCNPNDNNSQIGQKMAVDANNSNIVYVGVEGGGLYVTTNGGTTWALVTGVPAGTGAGICGIVFGPASNQVGGVTQVIYACRQGTGVYVTLNGGTSWALTSSGPTSVVNAILDASGNYWCAGNLGANIFKYNGSWTTASVTHSGSGAFQGIAQNPLTPAQFAAADQAGFLYFSADSGATWTSNNTNTTTASSAIPWIAAANYSSFPTNLFLDPGNLAFSPLSNRLLYMSAGTGMWNMNVPATPTSGTALVWNDMSVGIENLVAIEVTVPPGSGPAIVAWDRPLFYLTPGTYPSIYYPVESDDASNKGWSVDYASSDSTFTCGAFAGSSGYSHNNGASWTLFPSQAPTTPVGAYQSGCIAASSPTNILWAVAGNNAPSYTTDAGTTWTQISIAGISSWSGFMPSFPAGGIRKLCADRVTANTFYLYFGGNGLYISSNGGVSWTQQLSGFIETNSGYAAINPQLKSVPGNAGHLFYCTGVNQFSGSTQTSPTSDMYFFRSTNSGVTWTRVANVLEVSAFGFGKALAGGYPAVFINGFVSGVFGFWRSDDNCSTWNNIGTFAGPNGLGSVVTMSGDMNNYGTCYIGIGGFGASSWGAGCGYADYS